MNIALPQLSSLLRHWSESDEISSITVPAIIKMFVCGVSRVVACSCH